MRRLCLLLAALLLTQAMFAQPDAGGKTARQEWRRQILKRRPASASRGVLPTVAVSGPRGGAAAKRSAFPQGSVWFPGEWEEVQAVVLTPIYRYEPTEVSDPRNWEADPLVPGWASLYEYAPASPGGRQYGWQYRGVGPYRGVIDTASALAEVPLRLMDAVQQAGVQAWVHLDRYADSSLLLQMLETRGLRHDNISFFEAPSNAFWYRDCGPVCFYYGAADSIGMLDFQYYPTRAIDDSLPVYLGRHFGLPRFSCSLEWEGGNCLVDGAGALFTSDHVYAANADDTGQYVWNGVDIGTLAVARKEALSAVQVRDTLQRLVGPRATHILPSYRYDGGTGHIDLYVDMRDENTFVFSKMPSRYSRWVDYGIGMRNADSLTRWTNREGVPYAADQIPFPARDNGGYFSSQNEYLDYTRTYSNHTLVNGLLIQPCFSPVGADGMPSAAWDRANVMRVAAAYPGYSVYCIDVRAFDGLGGAIHCVTKQIPAVSPLRILHTPLIGRVAMPADSGGYPICAYITHTSGISSAEIVYRLNGGAWDSLALDRNADSLFTGFLPAGALTGADTVRVEYYLRATSCSGKTATKPYTALRGGCYSFTAGARNSLEPAEETEGGVGQFYPVPASGVARLKVDVPRVIDYEVAVCDNGGRTLRSDTFHAEGLCEYQIDVSSLPAGFYTVVFRSTDATLVRKLIVR